MSLGKLCAVIFGASFSTTLWVIFVVGYVQSFAKNVGAEFHELSSRTGFDYVVGAVLFTFIWLSRVVFIVSPCIPILVVLYFANPFKSIRLWRSKESGRLLVDMCFVTVDYEKLVQDLEMQKNTLEA